MFIHNIINFTLSETSNMCLSASPQELINLPIQSCEASPACLGYTCWHRWALRDVAEKWVAWEKNAGSIALDLMFHVNIIIYTIKDHE
jgi:hypothetical protein